jgi:hypothetical protein
LEWFEQTLTPLIGKEAYQEMTKLFVFDQKRSKVKHDTNYKSFLQKMKKFRERQK